MREGITIQIDGQAGLDAIIQLARQGNEGFNSVFQLTKSELFECAMTIENTWKGWATGNMQIPGVKNVPKPDSKLAASIKHNPQKSGAFEYTISSDSPQMEKYQNGEDYTVDMKAQNPWNDERTNPWLYGKKSRLNKKDGSPYLIIPFSWGTGTGHFRNVVPSGIQKMLRSRALSTRLPTQHTEPNARGEDILRHEYDWGGRVGEDEARHTDSEGNATGYDVGMVRMKDEAYGKNGNHGTYFTFRVISAKSAADKWIQHRHTDAIDIVGGLKKTFEEDFTKAVQAAVKADWERFQRT